jgi:glutathione S-transferase
MSPYGDYDTMLNTLTDQLSQGEYFLGEKFTSLDVLWGTALTWITMFKLVPSSPVIQTYIDRINARPSVVWVREKMPNSLRLKAKWHTLVLQSIF